MPAPRGRPPFPDLHDRFGLALVVFHLLFMGRHPFAGRYQHADDMPIEQAIEAEAQAQAICMQTADFERAFHAFVNKEKPLFEGD